MKELAASAERELDEGSLTPPFQIHRPDYDMCIAAGLGPVERARREARG